MIYKRIIEISLLKEIKLNYLFVKVKKGEHMKKINLVNEKKYKIINNDIDIDFLIKKYNIKEVEEKPISKKEKIHNEIKSLIVKYGFDKMLFIRIFAVYFIVSGINILINFNLGKKNDIVSKWQDYVIDRDFVENIGYMLIIFLVLTVLYFFLRKKIQMVDPIFLFMGLMLYSISAVYMNYNIYYNLAISIMCSIFMIYLFSKLDKETFERIPNKLILLLVIVFSVGICIFIGFTSVYKNKIFATSTFDFGIFAQMFHYMSEDLTAVTTCERDKFLSHFSVHASYIFYLILPIYKLFPSENTLLVVQAVLALSGIVPFYLISKNHNYKGLYLLSLCMIYIFNIAILSPCYYDFHENAFLPLLLMWFLYAVDKRKIVLMYVFIFLICIVKEDAPLYVICILLFFWIDEKTKKRIHGIIGILISSIYFSFITNWLNQNGDGKMMAATRFGNLTINPEDGFLGVAKNVILNPSYFFSLCINEKTLIFFVTILLPLLFIPFITSKLYRFFLIVPFIIMNMVIGSGYGYAATMGYQYTFGTICLLLYLFIINIDDIKKEERYNILICASTISIIISSSFLSDKTSYYKRYQKEQTRFEAMEAFLDSLPQDASVISNTWYLPHIADRKEIYILDQNDIKKNPNDENIMELVSPDRYDLYVMSHRDENTLKYIELLHAKGFTLFDELEGDIIVYAHPNYKTR